MVGKITKDQAFRAVVAKWEAIVNGKEYLDIKDIKIDDFCIDDLPDGCGYCHFYRKINKEPSLNACGQCPLVIDSKTCGDNGHPFSDFYKTEIFSKEEKEAAQTVLNLIFETKEKHFANE